MSELSDYSLSHTQNHTYPYVTASSNTRQQRDTMRLTKVSQQCTIPNRLANKETHDVGRSKADHLFAGMDTTGENQEKRNAISLSRPQNPGQNTMALYWYCVQIGSDHRRRDHSEVEKIGDSPQKRRCPLRLWRVRSGP